MSPIAIAVRELSLPPGRRGGPAVLRDVGFDVPAGTLTAVMGPSGSGKSALLRRLADAEKPGSGTVSFPGGSRPAFVPAATRARPWRRRSRCSTGEERRDVVAVALSTRASALLLDDPTAGMDPVAAARLAHELRAVVDRSGRTILAATHDSAVAAVADRVLLLSAGAVVGDLDRAPMEEIAESVREVCAASG